MYRCDVCKVVSLPGTPRRTYNIIRVLPHIKHVGEQGILSTRTEIISEIPVCGQCKTALDTGVTLAQLREAVYLSGKLREVQGEAKARSVAIMMVPIGLAPKEVKKPKVKKSVGLAPVEVKTGEKPWVKPKTKKLRVAAGSGKPKGVKQPGQRKSRKSSG